MSYGRGQFGESPEHLYGDEFSYQGREVRVDVWYDYSGGHRRVNVAVATDNRGFGSRWDRYGIFEVSEVYEADTIELVEHVRMAVQKAKGQINTADKYNSEAEWNAIDEEIICDS